MPQQELQREVIAERARGTWAVVGVACLGWILWVWCCAATAAPLAAGDGSHGGRPEGARLPASPALRAAMSAALGRDDAAYAVGRAGGGYTAVVRGGAVAAIRGGGVAVSVAGHRWEVSAARLGRGGRLTALVPRSAGVAVANRVELADGGVASWFVNGPAGLEQGWTIDRRPAGRGDLRLGLALRGDLRARIAVDGREVGLVAARGEEVLRYAGLSAYDAGGREVPARFAWRQGELQVVVEDALAVYPLTVDPFIEVAKLQASGGHANDNLGQAVGISSDGTTIVAAAAGAFGGRGAIYVFSRPAGGVWSSTTQTALLTASDGASGDNLGHFPLGVAVSADGSTVVAGAPYATVFGHADQGAAYVFVRSGGAWSNGTEAAKLVASDGALNDGLESVSVSGDGATVVASSFDATVAGHGAQGALYVFVEAAAGWSSGSQTAKLVASDGEAGDGLGLGVAMSGDGTTIVAGAISATVAGHSGQGAVYLFAKPSGGWTYGTQTAKLTASDGEVNDFLGIGVAASQDGSTVAAGADSAAVGGNASEGAVYVFVRPAGGWSDETQAAKLTESDGAAFDLFGNTAAVSSDGTTIVGGTRFATVGGNANQGAAYVFEQPGSSWTSETEAAKLTAADGAAGDEMGLVAVSGDGSTVVTGALFATVSGNAGQGAAYVFSSACVANATTLCIDDQPGDRRWQVTASYATTEGGGLSGSGQAIPLASLGVSEGGLFWFFDSSNPEMLFKVIDGCAVNEEFWVFLSATTNVGFTVTVLDTETGRSKVYRNKDGTAAPPIQDTSAIACIDGDTGPPAFAAASARRAPSRAAGEMAAGARWAPRRTAAAATAPAAPVPAAAVTRAAVDRAACAPGTNTLCIAGRFQVEVHYHTAQGGGSSGAGTAIGLESLGVADGGLFWFFAADNPEMLVKVLDACSLNDKYWIFYAAGTNVGFTLTVTDSVTGEVKTYRNADGTAAPPVQDTSALPCG